MLGQRQCNYYDDLASSEDAPTNANLLSLTDWGLSTGCANRDAQNALKWALAANHEGGDVKDSFIAIESLRNAFHLVYGRIGEFVSRYLELAESDCDKAIVYEHWASLGVGPEMAEALSDLDLFWSSGRLRVSHVHRDAADVGERVTGCLIYFFKWRKFNESRWLTIGAACRAMVGSLSVGLHALVDLVQKDQSCSDFYLHGFGRLNERLKKFCVVASVASTTPDSVLMELLEDERVSARLSTLTEAVQTEVGWVCNLSDGVYARFASAIGQGSPQLLRTQCFEAANTTAGFIDIRIFRVARSLPRSLCQGDIEANLTFLHASPKPEEYTSEKIWSLLQLGFSRRKLVEAVQLFRDAAWSTAVVEQAHGSLAAVRRVHSEYGVDMLCLRCMVHVTRALFFEPRVDPTVGNPQKALVRLGKRRPETVTGRHMYLQNAMAEIKEVAMDKEERQRLGKAVRQEHGAKFAALPLPARMVYEDRARLHVHARRDELADKVVENKRV